MRLLLTILLIAVFKNVASQSAPDFTVTDIDGNEISLYEDLLDQGKSVVLEFNTLEVFCSGCADTSPYFEDFYQYWGAGNGDMEMLFISPQDSDNSLASFEDTFGLTYPKVGTEGGGDVVFDAYCSGDFGNFHSLPVYVVIAPDGNVAFNPVLDNEEILVTIHSILNEFLGNDLDESDITRRTNQVLMNGSEIVYNIADLTKVQLFNLAGQQLLELILPAGKGRVQTSLPTSIMIMHVSSGEAQWSVKISSR